MSRRSYHRAFYWRTVDRRRKLARDRKAMRRNTAWLLAALREEWA